MNLDEITKGVRDYQAQIEKTVISRTEPCGFSTLVLVIKGGANKRHRGGFRDWRE